MSIFWLPAPMVAVWRVSGMSGSVVCGGKWNAGSVVCCGQCYVGEVVWDICGQCYIWGSDMFEVSDIFEVSSV